MVVFYQPGNALALGFGVGERIGLSPQTNALAKAQVQQAQNALAAFPLQQQQRQANIEATQAETGFLNKFRPLQLQQTQQALTMNDLTMTQQAAQGLMIIQDPALRAAEYQRFRNANPRLKFLPPDMPDQQVIAAWASATPDGLKTVLSLPYDPNTGQFGQPQQANAGGWAVPEGRVSSPFGDRMHPTKNKMLPHKGVDVALPEGAQVQATYGGTVAAIDSSAEGGTRVVLDHGDFQTEYLHMGNTADGLVVGQQVQKGQALGAVGPKGPTSTGAHLEYRVKQGGEYVDPLGDAPQEAPAEQGMVSNVERGPQNIMGQSLAASKKYDWKVVGNDLYRLDPDGKAERVGGTEAPASDAFKYEKVGNAIVQVETATGKTQVVYEGKDVPKKDIREVGGRLLLVDPETKKAEVIYESPAKEEASKPPSTTGLPDGYQWKKVNGEWQAAPIAGAPKPVEKAAKTRLVTINGSQRLINDETGEPIKELGPEQAPQGVSKLGEKDDVIDRKYNALREMFARDPNVTQQQADDLATNIVTGNFQLRQNSTGLDAVFSLSTGSPVYTPTAPEYRPFIREVLKGTTSLWDYTKDTAGLASTLSDTAARTFGQLFPNSNIANQTAQARQAMEIGQKRVMDAYRQGERYIQGETDQLETMFNIAPSTFDSPQTLRSRMRQIDDALRVEEAKMRFTMNDRTAPREKKEAAYAVYQAIVTYREMARVPPTFTTDQQLLDAIKSGEVGAGSEIFWGDRLKTLDGATVQKYKGAP